MDRLSNLTSHQVAEEQFYIGYVNVPNAISIEKLSHLPPDHSVKGYKLCRFGSMGLVSDSRWVPVKAYSCKFEDNQAWFYAERIAPYVTLGEGQDAQVDLGDCYMGFVLVPVVLKSFNNFPPEDMKLGYRVYRYPYKSLDYPDLCKWVTVKAFHYQLIAGNPYFYAKEIHSVDDEIEKNEW